MFNLDYAYYGCVFESHIQNAGSAPFLQLRLCCVTQTLTANMNTIWSVLMLILLVPCHSVDS